MFKNRHDILNRLRTLLSFAFCLVLLSNNSKAQNLVANPGFEEVDCMLNGSAYATVEDAPPWFMPNSNSFIQNSYLLSTCFNYAGDCTSGVPDNPYGYSYPHEGNSYAAVHTYTTPLFCPTKRNYICTELLSTLQPGAPYELGFWTKRSPFSPYVTAIGLYLWDTIPNQGPFAPSCTNALYWAEDGFDAFGAGDTNWTYVSTTYFASGAERYISIGNHLLDEETPLIPASFNANATCGQEPLSCIYLIDDVNVRIAPGYFWVGGDEVICEGETATIVASGELSHWEVADNPGVVYSTENIIEVSPAQTTTYIAYGLIDTMSIVIEVLPAPYLVMPEDVVVCEGDSLEAAIIHGNGSYSAEWGYHLGAYYYYNPNYFIFIDGKVPYESDTIIFPEDHEYQTIGAERYFDFIATVDNGVCKVTDTTTVTFYNELRPLYEAENDTIGFCEGDSVYLSFIYTLGTDNVNYYDANGEIITVYNMWIYEETNLDITLNYDDQCYYHYDDRIEYYPSPDSLPETIYLCPGESFIYDPPNAVEALVNQQPVDQVVLDSSGEYLVRLNGQCEIIIQNVVVIEIPDAELLLPEDTSLCEGDVLALSLSEEFPDFPFIWQDESIDDTVFISQSGIYSIEYLADGCALRDSIEVTVIPYPVVELGSDTILCVGDTLWLVAGDDDYVYQWQDATSTPTYAVTEAGAYSVEVSDWLCTSSDSINVEYYPQSTWQSPFPEEDFICIEEPIEFSYTGDYNITWPDGSHGSSYAIDDIGIYVLQAEYYCDQYTDTLEVDFLNCDCGVYLPQTIIISSQCEIEKLIPKIVCDLDHYRMRIFTSDGKVVSDSSSPYSISGNICDLATGQFHYLIEYQVGGGSGEELKGKVVRVR